jgi:phosphatidylinositol kinase/protein kinase (PI-3  family)
LIDANALVKAMYVSGIEGSYRITCLRTMTLLRDSRDSLLAMLEAFVYDPLISWRLTGVLKSDLSEGLELNEEGIGKIPSRNLSMLNDSLEGVLIDGRPSVLHESAVEGFDEEGDDNNCNPPRSPQRQ